MTFKFIHTRLEWAILFLIFLGIIVRAYFMATHFTHVDDAGIAVTILHTDILVEKILLYTGWSYEQFCHYLENPFSSFLYNIFIRFVSFAVWTYAPFQFLFMVPLTSLGWSYQSILVFGRLSSFLFGAASLFVCFKVIKLLFERDVLALFGVSLVAFSWECIIYSAQMEPYIITVFFIFLQLYCIYLWSSDNISKKRKEIIILVVGILSCYAQYQLFVFVFAMYVSLLIKELVNKNKIAIKRLVKLGAVNFVFCLPVLLYLFVSQKVSRGVNWNAGIHEEFVFKLPDTTNLLDMLVESLRFLITNLFLVVKYFFTSDVPYVSTLLSTILCVLLVFGACSLHRSKMDKSIVLYIDIALLLLFVMILRGNLTLGPSRHNLVLVPLFILIMVCGLRNLIDIFDVKRKNIMPVFIIALIIVNISSFIYVSFDEAKKRKNFFSEEFVNTVVRQYKPYSIIGINSGVHNLPLMNIEKYELISSTSPYSCFLINSKEKRDKFVVVSDRKFSEDDLNLVINESVELSLNKNLDMRHLKILFSKEIMSDREIDYASAYYDNSKNGMCVYVFQIL